MAIEPAPTIEIREARLTDAGAAARLSDELGYPVDDAAMQRRIDTLHDHPDHALFVACCDGTIAGWIHVHVVHRLTTDARAEIGGLVVGAQVRSRGIGAQLLARAERWAVDRDLTTVAVRSQVMRGDAHRFYIREGYSRTKTSAVFTKDLRPS